MKQEALLNLLTGFINMIAGEDLMTSERLKELMIEAKKAEKTGGINGVLEYLMQVTNAKNKVDKKELTKLIQKIKKNPALGFQFLENLRN
ncbi:MAG: hypothetical protein RLZ12_671 [Bacillota bacterium]|jgi:DNA invertase Pin-like site-specific DNA recombinase